MDDLPPNGNVAAIAVQQMDARASGKSADLRVYENDEFITVFVRLESPSGQHQAWGAASAARQPRLWRADGQLAPDTAGPNEAALTTCLRRAQRMAAQELQAASASQGAADEAV